MDAFLTRTNVVAELVHAVLMSSYARCTSSDNYQGSLRKTRLIISLEGTWYAQGHPTKLQVEAVYISLEFRLY